MRNYKEKSFLGLELLRFLCSLSVLIWHYQHFFKISALATIDGYDVSLQPLYSLLWIWYELGGYAVQIFWALSGFIFFWKYAELIRDGGLGGREFFTLRFSRLYPLHFLTLVFVALLQWGYWDVHGGPYIYLSNDVRHFALNLFMASHWGFQKNYSFNGPIWSVSIEVLAYAAFFLIARRVAFTPRNMLALIVTLTIFLMALPGMQDIMLCLLFFFAGGCVHVLVSRTSIPLFRTLEVSSLCFAALLGINILTHGKVQAYMQVFLAVSLLSAFLLVGQGIRGERWRALCTGLGNLTYSSYLLHFPLQLAVVLVLDHWGVGREVFYQPYCLGLFVVAAFALSHLSFTLIEHPAQSWLRRRYMAAALDSKRVNESATPRQRI
ncbi:MAG: acyltransferase family protein [Bacteroidota bacterium]